MTDARAPLSDRSAEAGARLLERSLALPLPLRERLVDGELELSDHDGELALCWLASFERHHGDDPETRRSVAERAQGWLDWLVERWARRWGPATARTPQAWTTLPTPPRRREPDDVAQLCWNHSLMAFAAWSRGARWFGAGLYEPGTDATIHLGAFVGRIGPADGPPDPPARP